MRDMILAFGWVLGLVYAWRIIIYYLCISANSVLYVARRAANGAAALLKAAWRPHPSILGVICL
jgi:hypothetical protein